MNGTDKSAVREDYRSGYTVRMLAAKYGVPKSTISDWVKRYGWQQEQRYTPVIDLVVDAVTESDNPDKSDKPDTEMAGSGDFPALRAYTMKLLQKADQLLEIDDALAPRDLKSLSSMLLDVRQLLGILSPREAAEQEIRLITLRRQAEAAGKEAEDKSTGVVVRFIDTEGAEE